MLFHFIYPWGIVLGVILAIGKFLSWFFNITSNSLKSLESLRNLRKQTPQTAGDIEVSSNPFIPAPGGEKEGWAKPAAYTAAGAAVGVILAELNEHLPVLNLGSEVPEAMETAEGLSTIANTPGMVADGNDALELAGHVSDLSDLG